ncbi:hypothetical protein F4777DRAFT_556995 [Nemania sp. FL0916]|nr:hypothetical protein F4777DRAFT_556995 [Nemania sp. FL0916]
MPRVNRNLGGATSCFLDNLDDSVSDLPNFYLISDSIQHLSFTQIHLENATQASFNTGAVDVELISTLLATKDKHTNTDPNIMLRLYDDVVKSYANNNIYYLLPSSSNQPHSLLNPKNLASAQAIPIGPSAAAKDRSPLQYTNVHRMFGLTTQNSAELEAALRPERMQLACEFYDHYALLPKGPAAFFQVKISPIKSQEALVSLKEILDSILQMITLGLGGSALTIRCCQRLDAANLAALRFGLGGRIILHSLETDTPITFVCCDETFPYTEWAREATEAFRQGAMRWAGAGLSFQEVGRNEPAYFRITFSLFPKDLDCNTVAHSFFPGTQRPEERTLWVYLLAFHPFCRPHMAGYMGHEAGHICGARHSFDEHLLPDGSENTHLKSVMMGTDDPSSIMKYYDDPSGYAIQASDVQHMKSMYDCSNTQYQGHEIIKVKPHADVYAPMMSFKSTIQFLLSSVDSPPG